MDKMLSSGSREVSLMDEGLLTAAKNVREQVNAFLALQAQLTPPSNLLTRLKRLLRPVDFKAVVKAAQEIEQKLGECLTAIAACPAAAPAEREFKQLLSQYTAALADAATKLIAAVEAVWINNRGRSAWETNRRLMQEYQLAEKKYIELGVKLNACYKKLTSRGN